MIVHIGHEEKPSCRYGHDWHSYELATVGQLIFLMARSDNISKYKTLIAFALLFGLQNYVIIYFVK